MADCSSTRIGMIVDKSNAHISSSTDVLPPSEYYSVDVSVSKVSSNSYKQILRKAKNRIKRAITREKGTP